LGWRIEKQVPFGKLRAGSHRANARFEMTINIMTITMGRPTALTAVFHIARMASIRHVPASERHAEFVIDLIAV
jgi:hypothetical protein